MEAIYISLVVILFALAISDLIVGVSNDAVNFLNSAIGAKVAPYFVIMIIASIGIIVGTTFSSGMMEVARSGIFHPDKFYFNEIMIIFLAVMLTDVVLLDVFNTLGLPTSTTVSIVFELLGASVAISLVKIKELGQSITDLSYYINSASALGIISGILLSVVIAFTVGAIVMWISRLVFTFNYTKTIRYFGGIFGGIAITSITYFILIKGLKGSVYADNIVSTISLQDWTAFLGKQNFSGFKSLISTLGNFEVGSELAMWGEKLKGYTEGTFKTGFSQFENWAKQSYDAGHMIPLTMVHYVKYYLIQILLISFLGFSLIVQLLHSIFRLKILKLVVIIGTFALAMAFAGNDLVNFIGVPLAGLKSYQAFIAEPGADPDGFLMVALTGKAKANTYLLLIAGLVMVITLWLSKKARSVVKTSIDLSRQGSGDEKFGSTMLSRAIVRGSVDVSKSLSKIVPNSIKSFIEKRFDSEEYQESLKNDKDAPSFDMVRASVNLVVASILISIATSMKLPLSTTYVTFMVAMGSSLSDKAWGRESAVYRITGVITVIGGWFMTAITAFTVAMIIALIINWGGIYAIVGFALIALFTVTRTHISFKRKEAEIKKAKKLADEELGIENIIGKCSAEVGNMLQSVVKIFSDTINGLTKENRRDLRKVCKDVDSLNYETKYLKSHLHYTLLRLQEEDGETGHFYVQVIDYLREMAHALKFISTPSYNHIDNNHKPLLNDQISELNKLKDLVNELFVLMIHTIKQNEFENVPELIEKQQEILDTVKQCRKNQIKRIKKNEAGTRNSILYLGILNEIKNFLLQSINLIKSQRDFVDYQNNN